MSKILILLTASSSLPLLDGQMHRSGYWAEEFCRPYERFVREGYEVHVTTIAAQQPTPDAGSLTAQVVGYTRPAGSPDHDEEDVAHYRALIDALPVLKRPIPVGQITRDELAEYVGLYISGGHGAM